MTYNKIVEACFFFPRHVGVIDLKRPLTAHFRNSQPHQGVIIELYLECSECQLIKRACFKATGNPYRIAALEWLCRQIEGKALSQLPPLNYQVLVKELQIPTAQYPLAIQVEDAYKEVLTLMNKQFEV